MNKKPKEVYVPPLLVKHGLLRDMAAQFGELLQLENRPAGLKQSPASLNLMDKG
ncbi:MAG: hypothetical protein QM706_05390 [Nitrospira sp.]